MPVDAQGAFGLRNSRAEARLLDQFPKLHVVNDFHRQPPVRSDRLIGAPADELKRAEPRIDVRAGIAHAPRPNAKQEAHPEKCHHDLFADAEHFGAAEQREGSESMRRHFRSGFFCAAALRISPVASSERSSTATTS